MKLYVFRPDGHGPLTFMVLADSEVEAMNYVYTYIASQEDLYRDDYFGTDFYACEVYDVGEVAINDND